MARLPPAICDDCVAAVSLPFAFNFVGTDYANNCNQLQRNPHLQHGRPERCNTNYNWGRMNSATVSLTLLLSVQATAGAQPSHRVLVRGSLARNLRQHHYKALGSTPNQTFVVQFQDVCRTPFVSIARQAKALPLRRSSSRAVRSKCNTWTRCSAPGTHLDIPCRKAGRARNEAKYNAPIGGVSQLSRFSPFRFRHQWVGEVNIAAPRLPDDAKRTSSSAS